jgi:hypothetical protein
MKWTRYTRILLVLLAMGLVIHAQDDVPLVEYIPSGENNPWKNELANACYYGGTLSGKCNNTDVNDDNIVDQSDRDWMWNAGWHLIRQEYNYIPTDYMDDAYSRILPSNARTSINPDLAGCYEIYYVGDYKRWIWWPGGDSVATATIYRNSDCFFGEVSYLENVVAAETYEEADRICKHDLGRHLYPDRFANSFYRCVYHRPDFTDYAPVGETGN